MPLEGTFVDIHCHLLPGLDDGSRTWDETLEMIQIAESDGTRTIVATPRQLGRFSHNDGGLIRRRVVQLRDAIDSRGMDVEVLAGAAVSVDQELLSRLRNEEVITLGDHQRHVLLETPQHLPDRIETIAEGLADRELVPIWSRVERSPQLIADRHLLKRLVEAGNLTQITAGSLLGMFGPRVQTMAEWMLASNLVHFVGTAARNTRSHRPLLSRAFHRVSELTSPEIAVAVFRSNPSAVASGVDLAEMPVWQAPRTRSWWPWRRAA